MAVIRHDFGKRKRVAVRRFRQLVSLNAMHEANIRSNPIPYLERASERIYQLENALYEALAAARPPLRRDAKPERMDVDKAEYLALLRCRDVVERALAACRLAEEN